MIYTQKLDVRWRYLKRISPGIRPADAYIVMIQNRERLDLNKNFLRLRMKESNALAAKDVSVPSTVLPIVTHKPCMMDFTFCKLKPKWIY
jgi:hypothetical protein